MEHLGLAFVKKANSIPIDIYLSFMFTFSPEKMKAPKILIPKNVRENLNF